jgi:hypothetical protein
MVSNVGQVGTVGHVPQVSRRLGTVETCLHLQLKFVYHTHLWGRRVVVVNVGVERASNFRQDVGSLWARMQRDLENEQPFLSDYPVPEGKEVAASGKELFDSDRDEDKQLSAYKKFQGKEEIMTIRRQGKESTVISAENTRDTTRIKLTPMQEDEIRTLYATGDYTQTQLGETFGVRQVTIHRILQGKSK